MSEGVVECFFLEGSSQILLDVQVWHGLREANEKRSGRCECGCSREEVCVCKRRVLRQ